MNAAACLAAAGSLACRGGREDGGRGAFDALELLRAGAATTRAEVSLGSVKLYQERRFVITGVGANALEFPVTIPPNGSLRVGFAVVDALFGENFTSRAKPVEFAVEFRTQGGDSARLLDRTVDIARRPSDRRWHRHRVDLSEYAGRRGRLRLVNGDAGAVPIVWGRPTLVDAVADRRRPNLLFILVDALRADHVGSYGYARPTTPNLDVLAEDAVRYARAFTNAPMTSPSLPQILTSRYAPGFETPTLATLLFAGGVPTTRAIVNNPWLISWMTMMSRDGFDALEIRLSGEGVTNAALQWIEREVGDDRFALYVHYLDVHTPYRVPESHAGRFVDSAYPGEIGLRFEDAEGAMAGHYTGADRQRIVDLYDGAIHYVDAEIGRLLAGLSDLDLLDSTLVVVTADHGEELWDHGSFFHGQSLYDEQLHVPLLLRLPGRRAAGSVVDATVRAVDLMPTIADVLGLPKPDASDGESLLGPGGDAAAVRSRDVFARATNPIKPNRFGLRSGGYKLVLSVEDGREELYHLASDPRERTDVIGAPEHARELARLRAELARHREALHESWLHVLARADDGRPHRIDFRVAGLTTVADPDRVDLPVGDRVELSSDQRSIRWTGTLGPEPRGIRFIHADPPDPMLLRDPRTVMRQLGLGQRLEGAEELLALQFRVDVDGEPLPAGAIRLGGGGPPPSSPFHYAHGKPALAADTAPTLDGSADPVAAAIWRSGSPDAELAPAREFEPEEREQLRALGYAE